MVHHLDSINTTTTSIAARTPCPYNCTLEQVKFPIRNDMPQLDVSQAAGSMTAEWVNYKSPALGVDTSKSDRCILYIHGGAYFSMSRKTHRMATWRLSKYSECTVFSTDYRLAPQYCYPSALIDVLSAYHYLLNPTDPKQRRFRPIDISFVGDSAGGGLAMALNLYCRDTGYLPMPGALGLMSPYLDLTQSLPSWHLNKPSDFLPIGACDPKYINDSRSHPYVMHDSEINCSYVSPIFSIEDPENPLPPTLIQIGDAERPRDDSLFFKTRSFKNSDIQFEIYQDGVHFFQQFCPFDKMGRFALRRMGNFLRQQSGQSKYSESVRRGLIRKTPLWVANDETNTVLRLEDADRILGDGADTLVKLGIWKRSGNTLEINR